MFLFGPQNLANVFGDCVLLECLALAERRRAFGRALRLDGACDVTPVREWVASDESPLRGQTPR